MPFEPPTYFHRPAEVCEVRFFRSASNDTIAQMIDPGPAKQAMTVATKIVDVKTLPGTFKSLPFTAMKLPIGIWQYEQLEYASPYGYHLHFTAKDNPKIELHFSSPGVYFTDESHFKSIIESEPHELSKVELESIGASTSFTKALTENISGKRVIVMFGQYADKNTDLYRIEFNQNPDKSKVLVSATITFAAPPAEYKRYLAEVQKALKTIKWQKQVTLKPTRVPETLMPKDQCQD